MDEADKSLQAYERLYKRVPSIGFLSRKKRVIAYLKVTKFAQQMIDDKEISEDNAIYLLSILVRKYVPFYKSATMAMLNLEKIDRKLISAVGFKYANELRTNMQMYPVDDSLSENE